MLPSRQAFLCIYARTSSCAETFKTLKEASYHAILTHQATPIHKTQNGLSICPFTQELDCAEAYDRLRDVSQHLRSAHQGEKFPCAFAEEFGCTSRHSNFDQARRHAWSKHLNSQCSSAEDIERDRRNTALSLEDRATVHQGEKVYCPFFDESICRKRFCTEKEAEIHANAVHRGVRYPCPLAKEFNCSKVFTRKPTTKEHTDIHLGIKHPCPAAEAYRCTMLFSSKHGARRHVKMHESPFICPRQACTARFKTVTDMLKHSTDSKYHEHVKDFFLCPISTCKNAVTGKRLTRHLMGFHQKMHIKFGHVATDSTFEPTKVSELVPHSHQSLFFANASV